MKGLWKNSWSLSPGVLIRALKGLIVVMEIFLLAGTTWAFGSAVVTNGSFTNVYVYPDPDKETWEQHLESLCRSPLPNVCRMDRNDFSRANIDNFTQTLMAPVWPSYFDPLVQYSGINPPQFFGSGVASQSCVNAALRDLHNGVLQWDTIRSLANCHRAGMDPSPQVNLIFSPEIRIAGIPKLVIGTGPELCTATNNDNAWHGWGVNTPNFAVMPTSNACMNAFDDFTKAMSHEIVEMISDPAGMGMGDFGQHELGDNCRNRTDGFTSKPSVASLRQRGPTSRCRATGPILTITASQDWIHRVGPSHRLGSWGLACLSSASVGMCRPFFLMCRLAESQQTCRLQRSSWLFKQVRPSWVAEAVPRITRTQRWNSWAEGQ